MSISLKNNSLLTLWINLDLRKQWFKLKNRLVKTIHNFQNYTKKTLLIDKAYNNHILKPSLQENLLNKTRIFKEVNLLNNHKKFKLEIIFKSSNLKLKIY